MMCRLLLLTLLALFGLLRTATLAQTPPNEVTPGARPAPTAPGEALGATLDELAARAQWLRQGAEAATQVTEALAASSQRLLKAEKTIAATAAALGQQLAAARNHFAKLEAVRAADGATIARLQAELEDARAEARVLGERLEANERVFEQLNAALAAVRIEPPKPAEARGGEADRREAAAAGPRVPPPAAPTPPPGARSAGGVGAAAPADRAEYYAATRTMNLRAAPGNAAEVLAVVGQGDVVRGIGRAGDWLRVEYGNAGREGVTGWMFGEFLRSVEAPSQDGAAGG